MKIAFFGLRGIPTTYGGIERHVEELAPRLAERGHKVTVYCMSRYTAGASYRGVELVRLPAIHQKHLEMLSHSLLACLHLLFSPRTDIVHAQSAETTGLAWPLRLRSAVVATSHGAAYGRRDKWGPLARALIRLLQLGFVYVPHSRIAIAEPVQKQYEEEYGCRTVFIPNGVVVHAVDGDDALVHLGLTPGKYILYVGRLMASKGCHTLIDAYKRIESECDVKLVIVGDTARRDSYVQGLLRERTKKILFTGFLSGDVLWQVYAHCAAFVFPSTAEAMPFVLLEAMSFGVPVLYADVEENRLVAAGYARSFAPNDADDLAEKILETLSNPEEAAILASKAKQHLAVKYDWDCIVEQTERLYETTIAAKNAGKRSRPEERNR